MSDPGPVNLPTQVQVVTRLSELSRLLDSKTREIAELDEASVRAKIAFKRAYAIAWAGTTGSVDNRKQETVLASADLELAAEIAEMHVRTSRESIRTLRDQLDVGRSIGAAARAAEIATSYGQHT